MRKFVSGTIVLMTLTSGAAYGSDWIHVTTASVTKDEWHVLKNSGKIVTVGSNQYVQVTEEYRAFSSKQVFHSLVRIKVEDCKNGYGKTIHYDLAGNYKFSNDFVFGGTNVGSFKSHLYCSAALQSQTRAM